jgi:hypothetical protein
VRARVDIGYFHWFVPAEERSRCRGCAGSLDARPHVEVQLEPTLEKDGSLRLRRSIHGLRRLSRVCTREEIARGKPNDDSICPIEEIRRVEHNAVVWHYRDGALVR